MTRYSSGLGPLEGNRIGEHEDTLPIALIGMKGREALVGKGRGDGAIGAGQGKYEGALEHFGGFGALHARELEMKVQGIDDEA